MRTPESSPEFRFNLGPGLNYLAIWLFAPYARIKEDLDYDTVGRGVIRVELEVPSRLLWSTSKRGWAFSLRILGLGFTVSRIKL